MEDLDITELVASDSMLSITVNSFNWLLPPETHCSLYFMIIFIKQKQKPFLNLPNGLLFLHCPVLEKSNCSNTHSHALGWPGADFWPGQSPRIWRRAVSFPHSKSPQIWHRAVFFPHLQGFRLPRVQCCVLRVLSTFRETTTQLKNKQKIWTDIA